ncbi:anti-sigma-V factor rsiV [Bacillus sp. FJAT-29790]|uniref:anti-sigma-V factor rsiV n=1 Tax=Bacillus sp. FJAT-29790 TaxID=1895002 RepID=UPI001C245D65|nr:anti-sigma-V factor rsiV [Bacillus sp. FJAT-29790]MBU8880201.1 anti-sigma-V factor rsiV [Bacillus sp. FJAT-29790]
MDKKLEQLKTQYKNISIPDELNFVVEKALKKGRKRKTHYKWISVAAAASMLFVGSINMSPAMASSLAEVPVVGNIVKVLTFTEFKLDKDNYQADIKVPVVTDLENRDLAQSLNKKYTKEGKQLYEQFVADTEDLEKNGGGHLGVNSGYEVKTDNDRILSIGRYTVETVGSSSTVMKYDTIDKKNQILLSLPMLFKDERYVPIISQNIKEQMREQMKDTDSGKVYWVTEAGLEDEDLVETFEAIKKDQNFYINNNGKLVISFNKYEVAPGYMGVVEFVIPTKVISDDLVSHEYIK